MKVAVGSENPVKINAVKHAFKLMWPKKKWQVVGVKVPSGVSDQPMSDEESIKGATNRARRSLKLAKADFGVGLEGGIQKIGNKWFDCGWIVVVDKKGRVGIGSSARIETAPAILKLIKKGIELGSANDKVFKAENSKQKGGHFSLMTDGLITRKDGYLDAVIFALSRFLHPELW
jgi:inosine/xanthosine triphosphatase